MEAKKNIRRLLAGSSFAALLAASHPAMAAGQVYSGTNAGPITVNSNFDFVEVTGIINGDLTLNSILSNTVGDAGFELNGGSVYGSVTNTNKITVSSATTQPAVGMLAHPNDFDFITGNLANQNQITVTGKEAAAGILAFGTGVSIGGNISNSGSTGWGIKVKASQSAHSGTAVGAGIFVDMPTVYGDVSNSGSIKVNSTEISHVHHAATTSALSVGNALAIATGVGVGGQSSFQGLLTLSAPNSINGSVVNYETGLMNIKAHAAATHTAIANGSASGFGYATAVAGKTIDGNEADARAYGIYATAGGIGGDVGNSGTIGVIAVADAVNSAVAHGVRGAFNNIKNGEAVATADGQANAYALGAAASGVAMVTSGPADVFNSGILDAKAVAVTTNIAKADTTAHTVAQANARGNANAQATSLYDGVDTLAGNFVNTASGDILTFAHATSNNSASVIDPTQAYRSATAVASGSAVAAAYGMNAGSFNTIIGDVRSSGSINVSAFGNTHNTATVDVQGPAVAHAYSGEEDTRAKAAGVLYNGDIIAGNGGTGISHGGTINALASANLINSAKATGTSASAAAGGYAAAYAAGTAGHVTYLGNGYLNEAIISATALAHTRNQATANAAGTSLGIANAHADGSAFAVATGLAPTVNYLSGNLDNGVGGSLSIFATALVDNTAKATGGAAGSAYAHAYGTAHAQAYGIRLGVGAAPSISGNVDNYGDISVAALASVANKASATGQSVAAIAHDGYTASRATAIGIAGNIGTLDGYFYNSGDISVLATVRPHDSAVAHGSSLALASSEGRGTARASGISLGYSTPTVAGNVENNGLVDATAVASGGNYASADASNGLGYASLAGHMVAHAAGFDLGGNFFANGVHNNAAVTAVAIAGNFNGTLLATTGISGSFGLGGLSSLTGESFALAGMGGAFATGISLARAYATGYARADAVGVNVEANTIAGGFANDGAIQALAGAITTNEAQANVSGYGSAYAYAYGYGAVAHASGISLSAGTLGGGITNSAEISSTALAGSLDHALAQGTSVGIHGQINARAGADGNAEVDARGIRANGYSLGGGFLNSGQIHVLAGAASVNSAEALTPNGHALAFAYGHAGAYASGISLGFGTIVGDVQNTNDITALAVGFAANLAHADGTSLGYASGALARATGGANVRAVGMTVGAPQVLDGEVSNTGDISAFALGIAHNAASATGEYATAYARQYDYASATGLSIGAGTLTHGVANNGDISAIALAGSPLVLFGSQPHPMEAGPALGNTASAYGSNYSYAYAYSYARADAQGLIVDGVSIGLTSNGVDSVSNSGSIHSAALVDLRNAAVASSTGGYAAAYAAAYHAVAQATGLIVNAGTIEGNIYNDGRISVSAAGNSVNSAVASSYGVAYATAIGTARVDAVGISIGSHTSLSVGGNIVNDGTVIVQSTANLSNKATADSRYAAAYAGEALRTYSCGTSCSYTTRVPFADANAYASGIYANLSTLHGDFTNNGSVSANAYATSLGSANATGGTYAYASAYAQANAGARGADINATSIGGSVTNTGYLDIRADANSTAKAHATGISGAYAYANAAEAQANATGFYLSAGTLAGSFTNQTGGSMSVHATAVQSLLAKASGETYTYASASGSASAEAYGLDLSATTVGGDFTNNGALTVVAHASANVTASASSTAGGARAYSEVHPAEAYAAGISIGFTTLDGGFANHGVIIAHATADVKTLSTATGIGANASALGIADAYAKGVDFHTNSMGGSISNTASIWATAHAHTTNQAIASGGNGTGYAYGSKEGLSDVQAYASAIGFKADVSNTLGGSFTNSAAIRANALANSLVKATATGVSTYGTAYSNAYGHAQGALISGSGLEINNNVDNSALIHALAVVAASATVSALSGIAAASATARATGVSLGGVNNILGGVSNAGTSLSPATISAAAYATAKAHGDHAGVDAGAYADAEAQGLAFGISGSLNGGFVNTGTIRGLAVANAVADDAAAYAYATGVSMSTGRSISGGILNSGAIEGTASAHPVASAEGSVDGYAYAKGMYVDVNSTGIFGGISNSGSVIANAIVNVTSDFYESPGSAYATAMYIHVNGQVTGASATSLYNSGLVKAVASDPTAAHAKGIALDQGSYNGNFANVGAFSTAHDAFSAWTGGMVEATAHATSVGFAKATGLSIAGGASFTGGLYNSGLIKAKAVAVGGTASATAIKIIDGGYFADGIINTGAIVAEATGTSTSAVAINIDGSGKAMVVQQLGQLDPSDNVIGGIFGDIKSNNGHNDQFVWSGGQIVGDFHGDAGDSLTVFGGLGYKTEGDYHFVYDNNINTTADGAFDGSRFGVLNVNDAAHSATGVSLEVSGNMYLGALNVQHNGTLIVNSLTTKIDTTTLTVDGVSNPGGITWNLNNILVADQGQPVITAGTVDIGTSAKTVAHMASNGLYKKNNDYYLIGVGNYGADFNGTFGTLQNDFSNLYTVSDEYVMSGAEQGYHINVTRISFGDIPGMTEDGTNFGNYLDKVIDYLSENDPNGDLATLLSQILTGDKDQYGHAVNELSGHQNADMLLAALGDPSQLMNIIFGQLGGSGLGGSTFADLGTLISVSDNSLSATASDGGTQYGALGKAAGSSPVATPATVWARAFGNWATLDRNSGIGAAGFTSNGGGVVAGGDYKFSDNFKAGLAAGYQKDKVDFHGAGKSDITSWSLNAYARGEQGPLYVDGLVGYAHQEYSLHRYYQPIVPGPVYTANRDPNGDSFAVGAEAGYDYDLGNTAKLEPFIGFLYSHTKVDGSTETGTGPGNLTVDSQSADTASSRLGIRWSQTFGTGTSFGSSWTPMLELGWKHEFADTNPSTTASLAGIPGATFTVQGAGAPKDSAMVGAGLTMQLSDQLDGTVQYNGDFSDRYTDSTASLRLRLKF